MEPRVITHSQPATAGHLSARDRLAAVGMLLSGLTRDLTDPDGFIRFTSSEAADVLEHLSDIEMRVSRLRRTIVRQQPDAPDPVGEPASGVNFFGQPTPGCAPASLP